MHKCRDCMSLISIPGAVLCPRCRAAAVEKRKARKREYARELYRATQNTKKASEQRLPHPKPPKPCASSGCANMIEGNAVFCADCRHIRQLRLQRFRRDNVTSWSDDLQPEPPTSLQWLDKFKDWAGSGMSYADYQKAGMEKRDKARR